MVKSVKQAVEEVVHGKKQNFHITLAYPELLDAKAALKERGLEVRENFDGPIFEDIAGYSVNSEWVAVTTKEGETYVYPARNIARLKHYSV